MIRKITLIVLAASLVACDHPKAETSSWLVGSWDGKYFETKGMYAGQDCAIHLELKEDQTFNATLSAQMSGITTRIKYTGQWKLAEGTNKGPMVNLHGKISEYITFRGNESKLQNSDTAEIHFPLQALTEKQQLKPEIWEFPEGGGINSITINPLLFLNKTTE